MKNKHLVLAHTKYFQEVLLFQFKTGRLFLLRLKKSLSDSKEKFMVTFVTKFCTFPYPEIPENYDLIGIITLF